jgi:hypothetical protein
MDLLAKKELDTSRGFHYRYYISSAPSDADADTDADAGPNTSNTSTPALLHVYSATAGPTVRTTSAIWQHVIPHLLRRTNNRLTSCL